MPRERCQAKMVLISNYVWDGFKYIFTTVDHFAKDGWVISLNHNKAQKILTAKKKRHHTLYSWMTSDW